jgi:hypothetical protein
MRPVPIRDRYPEAAAYLDQVSFRSLPLAPSAYKPEIFVELEGGSFMSWWNPGWWERIRLLFGAPVRVLVNYCDRGPLHLDTEPDWGDSSPLDR